MAEPKKPTLTTEIVRTPNDHRLVFCFDGHLTVFKSDHPLEERVIELTEAYLTDDGRLLLPEIVAWDGVTSCLARSPDGYRCELPADHTGPHQRCVRWR